MTGGRTFISQEGDYPTYRIKKRKKMQIWRNIGYQKITREEYTLDWSHSKVFLMNQIQIQIY